MMYRQHDLFRIETMTRHDADFCFEQARREGWNPGLHDMDAFYAADPSGWFKAVDKNNTICGAISAVAYDATFGFVGFFVVTPDHRGGRIGLELGRHALNYLGDRIIGQDGVFAKVKNYEKAWGFTLAYRNLRYEWRNGPLPPATGVDVQPCDPALLPAMIDYDAALFPVRRAAFIEKWIAMPETRTSVVLNPSGGIAGWMTRRRCVNGYKIGPLIADTPDVAAALLRDALTGVGADDPVYLDVPEPNTAGLALVQSLGMTMCFGTARMYKHGMPRLDTARIFGVTSFELG